MRAVPKIDRATAVFGDIKHIPAWEECKHFWCSQDPETELIERWFYEGGDASALVPREGIDKVAALNAIRAILVSFEPKHEHKIAGCAFLLREWFTLAPSVPS